MFDRITITGQVTITRIRDAGLVSPLCAAELADRVRRGHAVRTQVAYNKVTNLGCSVIRALVGNGTGFPDVTNGVQTYGVSAIADLAIAEMRFGNSVSPAAPSALNYQLVDTTPLHVAYPTVSYPAENQVQWSGLVPANTYTGSQVTEEGLFVTNGALFARTTFTPETLVLGFGVQFDHLLVFAAT